MSRAIQGKILVRGTLVTQAAMALGGAGAVGSCDLELAVNGRGRLYVPGTSLAGALRRWVELHLKDGLALAEALFGFEQDRSEDGFASWLVVEDAEIGDDVGVGLRVGLQIDRTAGTARKGFLFDREVLPRGAYFPLSLALDLPEEPVRLPGGKEFTAEQFKAALAHLVAAIQAGDLGLGAARSRGLGRVAWRDGMATHYDFKRTSGEGSFLAWLKGEAGEDLTVALPEPAADLKRTPVRRITLKIEWEPVSPVMNKAPWDGLEADTLPLVEEIGGGQAAPVLTGAAIKGALRAQAARVLRSLMASPPSPGRGRDPDPDGDLPLLRDLFGTTDRAGRLHVDDCYQIENAVETGAWQQEDPTALATTTRSDHVAIDRFTGGAAEGLLYSIRTPRTDVGWEPLRLEVDLGLLARRPCAEGGEQLHPPADDDLRAGLALLLLVLRDLHEGVLSLGFGGRRGLGRVRLGAIEATGGGLIDGLDVGAWVRGEASAAAEIAFAWEKANAREFALSPIPPSKGGPDA